MTTTTPERRNVPVRVIVLVTILAILVGGLLWIFVPRSAGTESQVSGCVTQYYDVAVAPRMRQVVDQGLDAVRDECTEFRVSERSADDVGRSIAFGGARMPQLWIADTSWTVDSLKEGNVPLEVISPSLASTPVMVAAGPRTPRAASWGAVLSNPAVAMPDPTQDSVGTLALAASHVEGAQLGRTPEQTKTLIVPTAQRYGAMAANGKTLDLSLTSFQAGGQRRVVTTEQDIIVSGAPDVVDVTPGTGTLMLKFPLVVPGGSSSQLRFVARDLATWISSGDGRTALAEQGLRDGAGAPVPGKSVMGKVKQMQLPEKSVVDADLAVWRVLGVPSSILAVFDVSGSMDFPAPGGGRRIDVAVDVATTALDAFPDHARVGLWAFSIRQDGAKDYRVLAPLRRLDAQVGGQTQRRLLAGQANLLPRLTQGGTGLNDSTLAAYRQAIKDYDPNYSNSLIVLTDGTNDDPSSISDKQLLAELEGLRDPARPVRIVAIGLTEDANLAALRKIAEATGGRAYRADNDADILGIISTEIASR